MKKISLLLVLALSVAMLFSGCSLITNLTDPLPEEFIYGVDLPDEYPEDEFEVYDDAIVFESDDDEDGIELKYGTVDEVDDIIDYYEDLFDDNDLIVDVMEEDDDEFFAEGSGDGFKFEISAEPARGNYEERAFATVVEVAIEYYEMGEETLAKMQDFWHACGIDGVITEDTRAMGFAMDFNGIKMDVYDFFEKIVDATEIEFIEEATVKFMAEGEETVMDIAFETIDGIEVMTLIIEGDEINFERSSYDEMLEYEVEMPSSILLSDDLTDAELEYWISDVDWFYIYYLYSDNTYNIYEDEYNKMTIYSDYTGIDDFGTDIWNFTWYVMGGNLYIIYDDDTELYYPVDFEFDGSTAYLYLYDLEEGFEGGAWIYSNIALY